MNLPRSISTFCTRECCRSFKLDDNWKETDSLGYDDLLSMAKLFDLAHTWIMHQQQADAKGRKEGL